MSQNRVENFYEKLGIPLVSLKTAEEFCQLNFNLGYVPTLVGDSGIGKTALMRQIAAKENASCYFFYLAHVEREDLGGIPVPNKTRKSFCYLTEQKILEMVESEKPTYLILDEWNRGTPEVMNAAFTLMEQRRFGSLELPSNIKIGATMNPSEMGYLVNECEKDPAFRRRLAWLAVKADPVVWLGWAQKNKIHPLVIQYIMQNPSKLLDTEARDAGKVYANPASWEKTSKILYAFENQTNFDKATIMLSGHLGTTTAVEFSDWIKNREKFINPEEILQNYKNAQPMVKELADDSYNRPQLLRVIESVVIWLCSNQKINKQIGDNFASFLNDLNNEQRMYAVSLLANRLDQNEVYKEKFLSELKTSEKYKAVYDEMIKYMQEARKQAEAV